MENTKVMGSTGRTDSTETWSNNTRLSFDTYLLIALPIAGHDN